MQQDPVILRGVQCLEIQQVPVGDMYTQSLMAYAYTMWNRNQTKRTEIMNTLKAKAIKAGKIWLTSYWLFCSRPIQIGFVCGCHHRCITVLSLKHRSL